MAAIVPVVTQAFFVAIVATFGCTSDQEVSKLNGLRASKASFEHELYNEIFLGQCIVIAKGTVVEGILRDKNPETILVDRRVIPPGYIAPANDFKSIAPKKLQ